MDKRVERTQKLLLQSLMMFNLKNKNFYEISIRDLCEQAGIARQTFYRNYLVKEDIIIRQISNVMSDFKSVLKQQSFNASGFIQLLIQLWKQNQQTFALIEWAGISNEFIRQLANFNKLVMEQHKAFGKNSEYIANYYAGATYMFLKTFMEKNDFSQEAYAKGAAVYNQLTNQCKGLFEPLN